MTKRRSTAQLMRDRKKIAELYLKGWLQVDIAEAVGVDQSTVSRDIMALIEEWKADAKSDIDAFIAHELARISLLEDTYWQAWQRSTENKEVEASKVIEGKDGQRMEAQTRSEGQAGDPRFLQGVQWCIERRCKLLGLDEPERFKGEIKVDDTLTDDQRAARIAAILAKAQQRGDHGDD
jgi:hypothetical protein